jgi:hypothetical protein
MQTQRQQSREFCQSLARLRSSGLERRGAERARLRHARERDWATQRERRRELPEQRERPAPRELTGAPGVRRRAARLPQEQQKPRPQEHRASRGQALAA